MGLGHGRGYAALGKLFRSLEDHLGDDVWVVDPTAVPGLAS